MLEYIQVDVRHVMSFQATYITALIHTSDDLNPSIESFHSSLSSRPYVLSVVISHFGLRKDINMQKYHDKRKLPPPLTF